MPNPHVLTALLGLAYAAVPSDEVLAFPGVDGPLPSRMYSGYLPANVGDQRFFTHYTFTVSQKSPSLDPLVFWQQGSGSSFGFGFLTEIGPFWVDGSALERNASLPRASRNEYSWDRVGNILLFEHPPGVGFSYCVDGAGQRTPCSWNDETQAQALLASMEAFYASFSEFAANDLFVVGESYAGLFVPYFVRELLRKPESIPAQQLKAFAIGNGCTGTVGASPGKPGSCNGPFGPMGAPLGQCGATEHNVRFLGSHAALPPEQVQEIEQACSFPCQLEHWGDTCVPGGNFSASCWQLLEQAKQNVGDFYMYNFYDTCGKNNQLHGTSPTGGGQVYPCGTEKATTVFCNNEEVRTALHLKPQSFYGRPWNSEAFGNDDAMLYDKFSGDSYSLYPEILSRYSAIVYNGDLDLCVPWTQNDQWTSMLAKEQGYQRAMRWAAWPNADAVSGYVTEYAVSNGTALTFLTVKAAGHMVPMYQPQVSFDFLQRFLARGGFLDGTTTVTVYV